MKQANAIVERLVRQNGFRAALLTNELGLPLVAFPGGVAAEAPAAMVVKIERTFDRVHRWVGLRDMSEAVLCDDAGQRLVCVRILVDDHDLILAVLVPPKRPYRRAIAQAAQDIRRTWST
ncbi:MAG: hypothetical protein JXD18_07965 [Anaerolineae bacterium]|nr:hypothetical protein [Anaerolineae bacterium]